MYYVLLTSDFHVRACAGPYLLGLVLSFFLGAAVTRSMVMRILGLMMGGKGPDAQVEEISVLFLVPGEERAGTSETPPPPLRLLLKDA
ncbi:hypothetical protein IW261DRAFT_924892 [Armillaria novae-zelandiae]|uniref:Uncharacterized protein n=1 Tax=Armillaria novae-zelandiae TaxID=153914 RepID=A0AA39NS93_9AGAR|nr:hypothetical protein IW261DRAFT_924892 [Armillaria novae-zelandiae]